MGSRSLPAVFDGLHCKTGRTANDVDYEFEASLHGCWMLMQMQMQMQMQRISSSGKYFLPLLL
jgi:hypothetical protein